MTVPSGASAYQFQMKDIDGNDVPLDTYKGKVALIVNVASKCGYTYQYKGLEKLYRKYQKQGFLILGFPANDFLWQERGNDSEIKEFCSLRYDVTFPMFSKIHVKGRKKAPLYEYLTEQSAKPGKISWNFNKFLVDREGRVIDRFETKVEPDSPVIAAAIEKALAASS